MGLRVTIRLVYVAGVALVVLLGVVLEVGLLAKSVVGDMALTTLTGLGRVVPVTVDDYLLHQSGGGHGAVEGPGRLLGLSVDQDVGISELASLPLDVTMLTGVLVGYGVQLRQTLGTEQGLGVTVAGYGGRA